MNPSRGSSASARSTTTTYDQVTLKCLIQRDVSPFAEGYDMSPVEEEDVRSDRSIYRSLPVFL